MSWQPTWRNYLPCVTCSAKAGEPCLNLRRIDRRVKDIPHKRRRTYGRRRG